MRLLTILGTRPQLIKYAALQSLGGRFVGRDLGRVMAAMEGVSTVRQARERAATVQIPAVGAAKAIAAVLEAREELAA